MVSALVRIDGAVPAADISRGLGAAHGMSPADYSRAAAQATGGSTAVAVAR